MVEYTLNLDLIFHSLADATRRDILRRVSKRTLSIGTLAQSYPMSLAGVAKHIEILEKAKLVTKERKGKEQRVSVVPKTVETAQKYLGKYQSVWEERFEALDTFLNSKP